MSPNSLMHFGPYLSQSLTVKMKSPSSGNRAMVTIHVYQCPSNAPNTSILYLPPISPRSWTGSRSFVPNTMTTSTSTCLMELSDGISIIFALKTTWSIRVPEWVSCDLQLNSLEEDFTMLLVYNVILRTSRTSCPIDLCFKQVDRFTFRRCFWLILQQIRCYCPHNIQTIIRICGGSLLSSIVDFSMSPLTVIYSISREAVMRLSACIVGESSRRAKYMFFTYIWLSHLVSDFKYKNLLMHC